MQLLNNNVLNNLHLVTTGVTPFVSCFLRNFELTMNYGQIRSQIRDYKKFDTQMKITEKTVKSKIRIR